MYGGGETKLPASEVINGVHIHRVGATGFGRGRLLGRLADYISFYLHALIKAVQLPKMDVCVALTTPPFVGLIGLLLRRLKGTKVVLWTMDLYPEVLVGYGKLEPNSLLHRILKRLSRYMYGRAWKIISLGEFMTQRLIEAGAEPQSICTVDNWVPGEAVQAVAPGLFKQSPLGKKWGLNGRVTLMYSGNLGLGHELDSIVEATARIKEKNKLRLLFIGNGGGKTTLQSRVDKLQLDCVDFREPVPLGRLSESLAAGQIHFVSQKEGTEGIIVPSKLYGIMAAGRPVIFIGSRNSEVAQIIIRSQAGFVVAPGDVEQLTKTIRMLLRDAGLRYMMGNLARGYYETYLGRDRSVGRIVNVITDTTPLPAFKESTRLADLYKPRIVPLEKVYYTSLAVEKARRDSQAKERIASRSPS